MTTEQDMRAGLDGTGSIIEKRLRSEGLTGKFFELQYIEGGTCIVEKLVAADHCPDYDRLIRARQCGNDDLARRSEVAKKSAATRKAFGKVLGRPARQWVTGVPFND